MAELRGTSAAPPEHDDGDEREEVEGPVEERDDRTFEEDELFEEMTTEFRCQQAEVEGQAVGQIRRRQVKVEPHVGRAARHGGVQHPCVREAHLVGGEENVAGHHEQHGHGTDQTGRSKRLAHPAVLPAELGYEETDRCGDEQRQVALTREVEQPERRHERDPPDRLAAGHGEQVDRKRREQAGRRLSERLCRIPERQWQERVEDRTE
jgi:hypothetical protein